MAKTYYFTNEIDFRFQVSGEHLKINVNIIIMSKYITHRLQILCYILQSVINSSNFMLFMLLEIQ